MAGALQIQDVAEPGPPVRAAALAINAAAASADGAAPFDEHTLLALNGTGPALQRHLLAAVGGRPVGYAHLDVAQPGVPASAELAIHPHARRQGHGTALLRALGRTHEQTRPGREPLQIWSHGDQSGARVLAGRAGFVVVRALIQMRRSLDGAQLPQPALPPGVTVRTFAPGPDDATWLRVNARAFASHPEQGRMTQADLGARTAEPWFDPAGFFIAERDGQLIGYHWTKVHPAAESPDGERLGEVYVLGVDPDAHGGGLGTALTLTGLRHLQEQGLRTVLLYVEGDNAPALSLYRRLEFAPWSTDVMYRSAERTPR